MKFSTHIFFVLFLLLPNTALSRKAEHTYHSGKLVDITVDTTKGVNYVTHTYGIGGVFYTHIDPYTTDRHDYYIHVRFEDMVYVGHYAPNLFKSYTPSDLVVGDPIFFRFHKNKYLYIKRPDDKEMKVRIVKRVRVSG